ncbi:MAG: UDP-N-acetylglucosamine--N-acetylmuramyl-(pentapeptide) pyrophosphoryl-undecaprenol N-acetylglucosamine transferase [Methylococcaceae bacterium]|nr:UDP-N-acetylglucosamine--N-acetylmuramyl-(pentapeptide) pyrophosphoryl-undecaprenol N-acetylglucosamine transferase [Methylococcaceae bacterium]
MATPRFLFNAHNRRGLGHLMRGLNIAREIRSLAPGADILFYTRNDSAGHLCGSDFGYVLERDSEQGSQWPGLVEQFSPAVVVYDTLLPKQAADTPPARGRTAYIMRKCKPDRQQEIFAHPFLDRVDLILIPHDREEFGYEVPSPLQPKAHHVGPIVRHADTTVQQALRDKYRLRPDQFLLTSTVGGGGFEDKAEAFFDTVVKVHRQLHERGTELRHLIIKGPNYTRPLAEPDGAEVIDSEPDLVNLLAISDLVIAEGGYNTVNEIRLAKTPAVFLPSARNYADQTERVLELAERGLATVFVSRDPAPIADYIARFHQNPALAEGLRLRYRADRVATGNRAAAESLLRLATP